MLADWVDRGLKVLLEPGRSIMANAGVLITRVQHLKQGRKKRFVMCDAGIHTLIRPALYRAFPFHLAGAGPAPASCRWLLPSVRTCPDLVECDVVGPICETGDFLARGRPLPEVSQGDFLSVFTAGAYGVSMASNYNDHGRPAEVLVDGDRATVIAEREPLADLLETERLPRKLELPATDGGVAVRLIATAAVVGLCGVACAVPGTVVPRPTGEQALPAMASIERILRADERLAAVVADAAGYRCASRPRVDRGDS